MSQAKVDQYKVEKANRKETIAKEKRKRMVAKILGSIVGIALVAWIGVSTVLYVIDSRPVNTYYVTTAGLDDYLEDLYAEDTEETTEDTTEESTEDSTEDAE